MTKNQDCNVSQPIQQLEKLLEVLYINKISCSALGQDGTFGWQLPCYMDPTSSVTFTLWILFSPDSYRIFDGNISDVSVGEARLNKAHIERKKDPPPPHPRDPSRRNRPQPGHSRFLRHNVMYVSHMFRKFSIVVMKCRN